MSILEIYCVIPTILRSSRSALPIFSNLMLLSKSNAYLYLSNNVIDQTEGEEKTLCWSFYQGELMKRLFVYVEIIVTWSA